MKQQWNQIKACVYKEALHIWRDKRTMFILLGMPMVQILIFGFALSNELKNAQLVVVDPNPSALSRKIINRIDASNYFQVKKIYTSSQSILNDFRANQIKAAFIFPSDWNTTLAHENMSPIQLIVDGTDPNIGNTITNYIRAILGDVQTELLGQQKMPFTIQPEIQMLYNPHLNSAFQFVPGLISMVLMLICTMMTSIAIVREKEMGSMEVLLASPLHPMLILLSKAIPYFLLSLLVIINIFIISFTLLEVPIHGNLFLLLGVSMLYILTCLSLGLFISTITASQQVAMMISLVAMFLPTLMFSGFMFPIDNMPKILQWISQIIPARWFYYIIKTIMIKGAGWAQIYREVLLLLGMTCILLFLSLKKFKIRLHTS